MNAGKLAVVMAVPFLLLSSGGCSRSAQARMEQDVVIPVSIRVRNNLNFPLDLRATLEGAVIWTSPIAAAAAIEAVLGPLPSHSRIRLTALDGRGVVVTERDNVPVRSGALVWTIP